MKQKLLELVRVVRAREGLDLVPLVDDRPPPEPGRWTAKDQLAHLTAWREVAVGDLDAARSGGPPPAVSGDEAVENARIYERTRARPASELIHAAARSWDLLAAAIDSCSEEDLAKQSARRPEQPVWQTVPNNAHHVAEHLGYLFTERGDPAAAEDAAKWGYDLIFSTFGDDRRRGTAAYNLGCFYAARGRADEALPYLADAFGRRPDLRDWARQDADLDPIRMHPAMARLLG